MIDFGNSLIIRKEEVSERRNEIIADMFHEVHFVEKWGRGIDLILSKEPNADFKEVAELFITTFRRKKVKTEGVSEGVNSLLQYIINNPGKRVPYFEKALGVPAKTIERWLNKLKKVGKIKFRGSSKIGGYWKVVRARLKKKRIAKVKTTKRKVKKRVKKR